MWLPSGKGKGMEITGTFARRGGNVFIDMTIANRSLQAMGDFAVQFNKNSFGLAPAGTTPSPSLPSLHHLPLPVPPSPP